MSISVSPSTDPGLLERHLLTERLARTVCEIDPSPRNPFVVAVILEILGYTDQRALKVGWVDVFALARDIFDRMEFLRIEDDRRTRPGGRTSPRANAPSPFLSVVTQQAMWLVMAVLMIAWGLTVWSADHLPSSIAQALVAGILGSLVVSGGLQYAITRRLTFHTAQRDLRQARAFLHRALWWGGLVISACALATAAALWVAEPGARLAPLLAAGYFLLHGNYRLAVVPLIALHDVAGIVLSTGVGVGLLALTYEHLVHTGGSITFAVVAAQFAGLAAMWLASLARTHSLLGGDRIGIVPGTGGLAAQGSHGLPQTRWLVVCLDAAPWFATGVLYYLFLFGTRPIAWMLPRPERLVYESGVDLGILGIIPLVIAASWGLHRYYQDLREQLMTTSLPGLTELRTQAVVRCSRIAWRCRWFGITTAVALLAVTGGAPWGTMGAQTFAVFRITLVGLMMALPGFLFSFGLLTSVGALRDAAGVLVCGLVLQLAAGLLFVQWGTAGWLALALVGSAAVLSELAGWRAQRIVHNIDRFYYAAF